MATTTFQDYDDNGGFSPQLPATQHSASEKGKSKKDGGQGGWITFPFIAVGVMGLNIAAAGWITNLIVYLIGRFNIKSIDAGQISNVVNGCTNFFPIVGAILADSFCGSFYVVAISSLVSMLGMILMTLTASVASLRPPVCINSSNTCESPTKLQFAVLYTAITLVSIGVGGTRFTMATLGAGQFDKPKHQAIFFNWYFLTFYVATVIGFTGIVYIQDNIGWGLGFGLCLAANAIALAVIVVGKGYYQHVKAEGSPFTSIARVVAATIWKRKNIAATESTNYHYGHSKDAQSFTQTPSGSFRFLNRAALITEGDINPDGSIAKLWKLCTVQQVEDLKSLIRIFPLWSSSIFLNTPASIQISLTVLQAMTMDRHMGSHFEIPPGSFLVFNVLSSAICIFINDRFLFPTWQKLTGQPLAPLKRIGIGHLFTILGMAGSALVESKRLHVVRYHNLVDQPNAIVPISGLWLIAPLTIVGIGEAFQFPGQVGLYYQEFPASLRSTSTAVISLIIAIGFYLSTGIVDLVRRVTTWLPDNINEGRIDNVYWVVVVIGVVNFGYYLTCAMLVSQCFSRNRGYVRQMKNTDVVWLILHTVCPSFTYNLAASNTNFATICLFDYVNRE